MMKFVLVFLLLSTCYVLAQQCQGTPLPYCDDMTCGFKTATVLPSNTQCTPCAPENAAAAFTQCDTSSNKKRLFYFWRPPATCLATNATLTRLPSPIDNVDCSLNCRSGTALVASGGSVNCVPCAAGSVSQNGEYLIEDWYSLPPNMNQRCDLAFGYQRCSAGWRFLGDYAATVQNDVGIKNVLELNYAITNPAGGLITFEYQMSVSDSIYLPEERLNFFINGNLNISFNTTTAWTSYSVALPPGQYTFMWRNRRLYPSRVVEARIRKIDLDGVGDLETTCKVCPAGTYAKSATICKVCPQFTYSANPGSMSCTPCGPFEVSGPGSTKCTLLPHQACNVSDYYYTYSKCENGKRYRTANLITPSLCNPAHPNSIVPPSGLVDCIPFCNQGMYHNADGDCVYCPKGQYLDAAFGTCRPCEAGTGSDNYYYLSYFGNSPSSVQTNNVVTTGCTRCSTGGWRWAGDYLDTGGNFSIGVASSVWLKANLNILKPNAYVNVLAALSCQPGGYLSVSVSNPPKTSILQCGGCQDAFGVDVLSATFNNITLDFTNTAGLTVPFTTTLTIEFFPNSNNVVDDECNRVAISDLKFVGTSLGGSDTCSTCGVGTSSARNCEACPAGTFSDVHANNCTKCPLNTFSFAKSPYCLPCGDNRVSNANSTSCDWLFGVAALEADYGGVTRRMTWNKLSDTVKKFPYAVQNSIEKIYLNLDQTVHPVCGPSMMCVQTSASAPYVSVADSASVSRLLTDTELGVSMSMISYTKCELSGGAMNSTLKLVCDPTALTPIVSVIKRLDTCGYDAVIKTADVCPACVKDNYYLFRDTCDKETNKQYAKYVKKPGVAHTCLGNVEGLDTVGALVDCDGTIAEVTFPFWSLFIALAIIVIVIVIVAAVIGIIAYTSVRYKKLNDRLEQMKKSGGDKKKASATSPTQAPAAQ